MPVAQWSKVQQESLQTFELRKPLILKISKHFEVRYIVSFYTSFESEVAINDKDFQMLSTMLSGSTKIKKRKILLIINSPGGDPLASEKIIKVLSEYSDNDYWVLVPGVAKSAATMICLGSSKIILSPVSELGPIDLQIARGKQLIPAFSIINAYDKLIKNGINLKPNQRIEPILQQLQEFNASDIEHFRQINELASDIAIKVLKKGMLNNLSKAKIEKMIRLFIDPMESKVHGRPIFYSDIKEVDKSNNFNLQLIETTDDIWQNISEYHTRLIQHMRTTDARKILEWEEGYFRV